MYMSDDKPVDPTRSRDQLPEPEEVIQERERTLWAKRRPRGVRLALRTARRVIAEYIFSVETETRRRGCLGVGERGGSRSTSQQVLREKGDAAELSGAGAATLSFSNADVVKRHLACLLNNEMLHYRTLAGQGEHALLYMHEIACLQTPPRMGGS